jgi:hypothetical protein
VQEMFAAETGHSSLPNWLGHQLRQGHCQTTPETTKVKMLPWKERAAARRGCALAQCQRGVF